VVDDEGEAPADHVVCVGLPLDGHVAGDALTGAVFYCVHVSIRGVTCSGSKSASVLSNLMLSHAMFGFCCSRQGRIFCVTNELKLTTTWTIVSRMYSLRPW
jgi:hypothetical protein